MLLFGVGVALFGKVIFFNLKKRCGGVIRQGGIYS